MSALERRAQLIEVSRGIFAERGFDAASIEEIAAAAKISKPVVYEHFGDKESLYAIVVDREMTLLMSMMTDALTSDRPRELLEQAATALFDYIDEHTDGFRVLLRPHPRGDQRGANGLAVRAGACDVAAVGAALDDARHLLGFGGALTRNFSAPDAVTDVAEDDATEVVVPLDGGADDGRDRDAAARLPQLIWWKPDAGGRADRDHFFRCAVPRGAPASRGKGAHRFHAFAVDRRTEAATWHGTGLSRRTQGLQPESKETL